MWQIGGQMSAIRNKNGGTLWILGKCRFEGYNSDYGIDQIHLLAGEGAMVGIPPGLSRLLDAR
ncbi:hypothetical protein NSPZN2_40008 [Nitrospira defluvii]|uniref:Uncharacterized protein n=1 Tax=Nitrospira defluvii TaxID=330214 RepID=A0ABM8RPS4_9BACT|nr:hypothetical protein NSPZN2_40008 [Nitrospira defluvii]